MALFMHPIMALSDFSHHTMPRSVSKTGSVGPEIIITDWLLVCVSTLFFGLRIYSKFLRKTSLWWDDHILIAAWVS